MVVGSHFQFMSEDVMGDASVIEVACQQAKAGLLLEARIGFQGQLPRVGSPFSWLALSPALSPLWVTLLFLRTFSRQFSSQAFCLWHRQFKFILKFNAMWRPAIFIKVSAAPFAIASLLLRWMTSRSAATEASKENHPFDDRDLRNHYLDLLGRSVPRTRAGQPVASFTSRNYQF